MEEYKLLTLVTRNYQGSRKLITTIKPYQFFARYQILLFIVEIPVISND